MSRRRGVGGEAGAEGLRGGHRSGGHGEGGVSRTWLGVDLGQREQEMARMPVRGWRSGLLVVST